MSNDEPEVVYLTLAVDDYEPAFIVDPGTGLEIPNPIAGELRVLNNIGITVPIATELEGDVIDVMHRAEIKQAGKIDEQLRARIIPGTRVVETDHPAVINMLQAHGYVLCDPPSNADEKAAQAALAKAQKAQEKAAQDAEKTAEGTTNPEPAASGQEA